MKPPIDHYKDAPLELEVDTAAKRRWVGWAAYVLLYLTVSALLVVIFVKLSAPLAVAIGAVGFMVAYMTLMGYLASRNADRRE
jgi:hypothetical protein